MNSNFHSLWMSGEEIRAIFRWGHTFGLLEGEGLCSVDCQGAVNLFA